MTHKIEGPDACFDRMKAIMQEYNDNYLDPIQGPSVVHAGNLALPYLAAHAIHQGLTSRDVFMHFLDRILDPSCKHTEAE